MLSSRNNVGTPVNGHVVGELFKMMAGVNMVHVPYRGVAPALTDLFGGQVNASHCFPRNANEIEASERSASRHSAPGSAWEAAGSVFQGRPCPV
jgi:tripartite-type tricarboxylate transporter receptor subunit TctC